MSDTVNNGIPFVPENTIDPAAGLNLSLNVIDALLQLSVQSIGATTPPAGAEGDRHIVGAGATGDWAGQDNKMARYLSGAWKFYDAWLAVYNGSTFAFDGSVWVSASGEVSSVAMTVPAGFAVSGSPITSSGTLAVTFDTGYSIPTDAQQDAWLERSGDTIDDVTINAYAEKIGTASTGTISVADGPLQGLAIAANTAFTFPNLPSGGSITLQLSGDFSYTLTWPAGNWRDGAPPDLTGATGPRISVENIGGTLYLTYLGDWS